MSGTILSCMDIGENRLGPCPPYEDIKKERQWPSNYN